MLEFKPNLLLVDDKPENLTVLKGVIANSIPVTLETARSAQEALVYVANRKFDGILTDIQMEGIDGLELCRQLKADANSAETPIILITSHLSSSKFRAEGLAAGACDFISRPIDNVELLARIRAMLRTKRNEDRLRCSNANLNKRVAKQAVSLREYQKAVDNSPDLITTISPTYRYLMVNESFSRYHCLDSEKVVGKSVAAFLPEETFTNEVRPRLDACLQGNFIEFEHSRNYIELGQRYMFTRYCPLKGEDGCIDGVIAITRDITEHKQLETKLLQKQKMEALGTLAGGIAHDFNNILSAIFANLTLASRESGENKELNKYLQGIEQAADRAKNLSKQILTFSRAAEVEKENIQLAQIVKEALKLLRATLPASIDIEHNIQDENLFVYASPINLHQIIMNLCTNSYQAMEECGGTLKVTMYPRVVEKDDSMEKQGIPLGEYICVEISDSGKGIKEEDLPKIFDPFYTTKDFGKGTGLGLSIVHGIIENMSGHISVTSKVGVGTTFYVYFPQTTVHPPNVMRKTKGPVGGNESILMVDDEKEILQSLGLVLKVLGYEVKATDSPLHALEIFQENPDKYDLLITDQTMPRMSGVALAEKILAMRPEFPIIIQSGYSEDLTQKYAEKIGVSKVLDKPVDLPILAESIRHALESGK